MKRISRSVVPLLLAAAPLSLAGCGAGGGGALSAPPAGTFTGGLTGGLTTGGTTGGSTTGGTTTGGSTTGSSTTGGTTTGGTTGSDSASLLLQVQWPGGAVTGPASARSIQVSVDQGSTNRAVANFVIPQNATEVSVHPLPAGSLSLSAQAVDSNNRTIAETAAPVLIQTQVGQTLPVVVPMMVLLDHVSAPGGPVTQGQTLSLTAEDVDGDPIPAGGITWRSDNAGVSVSTSGNPATVTASQTASGTANVTAVQSASHRLSAVSVSVAAAFHSPWAGTYAGSYTLHFLNGTPDFTGAVSLVVDQSGMVHGTGTVPGGSDSFQGGPITDVSGGIGDVALSTALDTTLPGALSLTGGVLNASNNHVFSVKNGVMTASGAASYFSLKNITNFGQGTWTAQRTGG